MPDTETRQDNKKSVKKKIEVNPLTVMDRLKLTSFHIDSETKTVYLTRAGLKQVAAFFDFKLYPGVAGFEWYGWTYQEAT